MSGKLLDISERIDSFNLEILQLIKTIADSLKLEFFVVGATALDMTLNLCHGLGINRKTNDVDFCIRIGKWEDFENLSVAVINKGFEEDDNIMHRFYYKDYQIDLIPFGNVAGRNYTFEWPDKNKKEFSVIGVEEAFTNSDSMIIHKNPEVIIRFSSLPGLIILKLFAWHENFDRRIRDAGDIYIIITKYLEAGNQDRLFEQHPDIIEKEKDYELAGARLLGRDINAITNHNTIRSMLKILESENDFNSLTSDMFQGEVYSSDNNSKYDKITSLLNSLVKGLKDKVR